MPKIEISQNAFDYLKQKAEPLVDSSVTVLDRIIEEHKASHTPNSNLGTSMDLQFGIADMPSVKYTQITSASVGNEAIIKKQWNHILSTLISKCIDAGNNTNIVISTLEANTINGAPNHDESKKGYRFVEKANSSFQGLEANRALKNIALLCQKFQIPVEISIFWPDNGATIHPNKNAKIKFP